MTNPTTRTDFVSGFSPATYDEWRQLVEKALKGGDFDKRLVKHTLDDLRIEPLYTRANALREAQDAVPASAPFTRGTKSQATGLGWSIHQRVSEKTPDAANKVILEELEGGANGAVLQIAGPGQFGIEIASASDMATALTGVYLDMAPIQLKAGIAGLDAAKHFTGALPALGSKPGTAAAFLNVDAIGTLARFGTAWGQSERAIKDTVAFACETQKIEPNLTCVLVDATIPHEAGASEAQELAFLAATLVAYLREFEDAGLSSGQALGTIAFAIAADTDLFLTAAKVRTARRLIARIAEASNASAATMHITAVTSERMMAKRDPWTNMLRTTAACAGAVFGGADAISVLPYSWVIGKPDGFARRIARNTQLVLQEESSLGRVVDPAGGSWYVEKLTDELAQKSWAVFQDIEEKGGILPALTSGFLQDEIARVAEQRARSVAKVATPLTGVSLFPTLADDGVKVSPHPALAPVTGDQEVRPLAPHRLGEAFEALRDKADAAADKTGQRPKVFLANLGAIVDHNTRSTWTWNFLAAGGIEGLNNDGYESAEAAAKAFKESGAEAVCLCSSDEIYGKDGEGAAKALKAAGAKTIYMAGRPADNEAALANAGVNGYLFAGQDDVAKLQELQKALGIA